jgi:hypothetical protein
MRGGYVSKNIEFAISAADFLSSCLLQAGFSDVEICDLSEVRSLF